MTQNKRFRISQGYTNVFCHDWEKNKLLGFEQTVDCLNTFYEENEQLKQFKEQVASVIESKMGDNVCNDYKMEVLKEIWNELELKEVWFE